MIVRRVVRALTENRTETHPRHEDPTLRGRTYAVPFERVWRASLQIASDRWGWTVRRTDDVAGVIEIEAKTPLFRFVDDVEIRIGLDQDAQTRVDATSASRVGRGDLGTNARRIRRFFKHLDRRLEESAARTGPGRRTGRRR